MFEANQKDLESATEQVSPNKYFCAIYFSLKQLSELLERDLPENNLIGVKQKVISIVKILTTQI
jgi:hypothetical protein